MTNLVSIFIINKNTWYTSNIKIRRWPTNKSEINKSQKTECGILMKKKGTENGIWLTGRSLEEAMVEGEVLWGLWGHAGGATAGHHTALEVLTTLRVRTTAGPFTQLLAGWPHEGALAWFGLFWNESGKLTTRSSFLSNGLVQYPVRLTMLWVEREKDGKDVDGETRGWMDERKEGERERGMRKTFRT